MSSIQVVFYDAPYSLAPLLEQRLYYFLADIEPPVVETNVDTISTFRPTRLVVNRALFQNPDIEPPVVETNVHFLATFKPTNIRVNRAMFEQAWDIEPPVAETNVHFIATFKPAHLLVPSFLLYNFQGCDLYPPHTITDTEKLGLPIDYALAGDQERLKKARSEADYKDPNLRTKTTVWGAGGRISESESTFTVRTGRVGKFSS